MRRSKQIILALTILALILFPLIWNRYANTKRAARITPDAFQLTLHNESGMDEKISLWQNKENGIYYLILPSFADTNQTTWTYSGAAEAKLDEYTLQMGERLKTVENGKHILVIGGKVYSLQVERSANIPAVFIKTQKGDTEAIDADKDNSDTGFLQIVSESGELDTADYIKDIHARGNVSFTDYDKKSYQITLGDSIEVLGMEAAKKWLLIANCCDETLLRNQLAYGIAQKAQMKYTAEYRPVDVYLNGKYNGSYLLCEKVEIGSNRIPITDLEEETKSINHKSDLSAFSPEIVQAAAGIGEQKYWKITKDPEDITGGYLWELEYRWRYKEADSYFVTKNGQPVVVKSPKYISQAQMDYLSKSFQCVENEIRIADEDAKLPLGQYFDLNSFAEKYLIEEIVKNPDAMHASQFFYKDSSAKDSKIYAGPAWDYDAAFGLSKKARDGREEVQNPEELFAAEKKDGNSWWRDLYRRQEFRDRVVTLYWEGFYPVIRSYLEGTLRNEETNMQASAYTDYLRWPHNTDYAGDLSKKDFQIAYHANVDYLYAFLEKRTEYLNTLWK